MYQHLSHKDRVAIAVLRAIGHSLEEIAAQLRVHRSTVSREFRRNGDAVRYDASFAHKRARGKRALSKRHKRIVERDAAMEGAIRKHLMQLRRSPEQIAHVLGLPPQHRVSMDISPTRKFEYVICRAAASGADRMEKQRTFCAAGP